MEVFGSYTLQASSRDLFSDSIYPQDSRILFVPLNEDQRNCWLKFLELASPRFHRANFECRSLRCVEAGKVLLELNHPFVPVVVDFAVDAFNELCRMYFKKGVEDNIYEAEVTNVRYALNCYGYAFFITLEALEEDVVGVYEAIVMCDFADGRTTLLKFIRSPNAPVGACHKRAKYTRRIRRKINRSNPVFSLYMERLAALPSSWRSSKHL